MIRSAAGKVMWVGRATVFMVGLAVILALVFGVATTALGANGKPFLLGRFNVASAVSTLVKQGPGPALKLQVRAGQPPLAVNSKARVANLNAATAGRADSAASAGFATNAQKAANADTLDNKDSSAFFTGRQVVQNSATARPNTSGYHGATIVTATCPSGKFALGGGYDQRTVGQDMVIANSQPTSDGTGWTIRASNTATFDRTVTVYAVCAVASS